VILHGHYRDWFARYSRSAVHPGQLSFFGILRTYKGLDRLLEVFRQTPGDLRLRMAGRAYPPELGDQLTKLAELDERVELTCEYVDDQELVEIATEAELVVLPYREMHNSGSVLAALSLDRPVLVPWNEVTERLQREVGAEWVITYEDDLSSDVLLAALASARRRSRTAVPDLSRRDWDLAGRQHLEVYRRALDLR
ncbi:MAG TPA: glycosyltransferase, partial [Propionibacteriaceae bacterium]